GAVQAAVAAGGEAEEGAGPSAGFYRGPDRAILGPAEPQPQRAAPRPARLRSLGREPPPAPGGPAGLPAPA
ncbi:hypothetical protein HGM15179_022383, partial [Zosterops borbonicus]